MIEEYNQVLEKVELALIKGEYNFCIEYLYPIIESYPPSSKEGVNPVSYTHLRAHET